MLLHFFLEKEEKERKNEKKVKKKRRYGINVDDFDLSNACIK